MELAEVQHLLSSMEIDGGLANKCDERNLQVRKVSIKKRLRKKKKKYIKKIEKI